MVVMVERALEQSLQSWRGVRVAVVMRSSRLLASTRSVEGALGQVL